MGDDGGNRAANGRYHPAGNGPVENGGDHALAVAVATANGGNHALAHAAAAANGGAVAPALRLIPEYVLYLVLLRMPAAVATRFRATCRRWRDLTSGEAFRSDHHHLRSSRPMPLFFYRLDHDPQAVPPLDRLVRVNLRAVDIRGRASLPVMQFAYRDPALTADPRVLRIEGSCDGILLLSYVYSLYAYNPCTRRWARLPPLQEEGEIVGFYAHGPIEGREYRVLFQAHAPDEGGPDAGWRYWITSLGSPGVMRHIGRRADLQDVRVLLAGGISTSFQLPAVMVQGRLHWRPRDYQQNTHLLVFDTDLERFGWIQPPRVQGDDDRWIQVEGNQLLEINGALAMAVLGPATVDVWILQDFYGLDWVHGYQIHLPVAVIQDNLGYDDDGALSAAVFVVSQGRDVLVQCTHTLLQCDAAGTVLQTYQLADNRIVLSRYMLQESLLQHAFLPMRQSDATRGDPPFFEAP